MQIGIDSFAARSPEEGSGGGVRSLGELVERVAHAEQAGLDVFGIGEHHRREFLTRQRQ